MSNGAGKGPRYRKVDPKKWDAWWDQYEAHKKKTSSSREECCFKDTCCEENCDDCLVGEVIKETKLK